MNQEEAERLLKCLDNFSGRIHVWERGFIKNMIDRWDGNFTANQKSFIISIAERHGIR